MGAYDNPAIIRDRSAEIYGKAVQSFGQSISQGVMNYAQIKAKQREETDKQNLKDQNILLEIELAYDKDYQENKNLAAKTGTPMLDSFEVSAKGLLNGVDGSVGAKQARFELMTKKNLSKDERQGLLDIVNNYQTFMGDAKLNMGSMIAEKEEYLNFTRSDLGRKSTFKGSGIEKTRNMFTYLALNNNSAPEGVTYEKRLYAGSKGENMVYAKTTFDENSATFKNLSKSDQDEIRKNGMSLVFDQNWNDWRKDGFLTDIMQGLDSEKMQESIKFKDDSGGLTDDFSTDLSLKVRSESGSDITSQQNIVNTPLLLENLYEPASNKASVIMNGTPQEQNDYIAFTLGRKGSDFDRNKTKIGPNGETFQEMVNNGTAKEFITKETQELFLEDNLTRGFGKDKRGYVKRRASKEQAAAINKLNKTIEGYDGEDITEGADVYVKDTDLSLRKSSADVADPLVQIRKENSTLLDNLYGFENQKNASDFFLNSTYGGKGGGTIVDVQFVKGDDPASDEVTLTWNSGKFTETIDGVKNTVNTTDSATFDLNNPARMDTLLRRLLLGRSYLPSEISKMRSDLKKQLRERIAKNTPIVY
jgi:hypothetical protein